MDVDFLLLVDEPGLERSAAAFVRAGMHVDAEWSDWNPMLRGLQLRVLFGNVAIDLLRPRDPHDRHAFHRRRRKRFAGRYYDAVTIVERCRSTLNRRYLLSWARRLGVERELAHVLRRG